MDQITFPLKQRHRGAKVANLQTALQQLLDRGVILASDEPARLELAADLGTESAKKTYGGATRKLVGWFQQEHRLQASGEVDEPTARALNDLLAELGAPGPAVAYQVQGRVASRISASVGSLRVLLVDKSVGGDRPLAETASNSRGNYEASFSDAELRRLGKEKPDLQVRVFAGKRFLAASEVRYDASTRETLDVFLDEKSSSALQSEYETLTSALAERGLS